jgi:multiple sugar transport system ATP-binding protein
MRTCADSESDRDPDHGGTAQPQQLGDPVAQPGHDVPTGEGTGRNVIMGLRPEHFKDAALVGDEKSDGLTFSAAVDVLEWLGSDLYAYFHIPGARATTKELDGLAADTGATDVPGASEQITARLDIASTAREGQKLELWFDPHKMHLFNPDTGAHLTL